MTAGGRSATLCEREELIVRHERSLLGAEPLDRESLEAALVEQSSAAFRVDGRLEWLPTPVYRREPLPVDRPGRGPAIVVQLDTTTLVPPGATLLRTPDDTLRMTV
mgnify:CR=1 FL=1